MNKKAILEIIGRQHYGADHDDKVELTTVGTIEETDDKFIIRYTEEQEPPSEPIRAKLSIDKNEASVEMLRSGSFGSCLIIEKSKRNLCRYGTEYGDILMGIYGRNIEAEFNGKSGKFCFEYDVDVNGALTSQNEVTVNLKIN